jgi:predicted metal-dependent enzyme (double-stranded beta helix superfamily)
MFSIEQLIADCRAAVRGADADRNIKEIVARAVSRPAEVERALGAAAMAQIAPLYRGEDLTILNVIWAPGMSIYPHDHRTWAVIGLYAGTEDNYFFKRRKLGLERASFKQLEVSDVALLGEPTIHAVTNPLTRFTGAIHIYGGDFFAIPRSEFDAETGEERPYDVEKAKRLFADANKAVEAR